MEETRGEKTPIMHQDRQEPLHTMYQIIIMKHQYNLNQYNSKSNFELPVYFQGHLEQLGIARSQ